MKQTGTQAKHWEQADVPTSPATAVSEAEETTLLRVSLHDYLGSLEDHQAAFLQWLEELSYRPTEVDRYQYKKIR